MRGILQPGAAAVGDGLWATTDSGKSPEDIVPHAWRRLAKPMRAR